MFDGHAFADSVGALFFKKAEARLGALLAEYGVSDPSELPLDVQGEILQRAIVETAAANFPTANIAALRHGFRSFTHPAFIPAFERVMSWAAGTGDPFGAAEGADAAVVLAAFGLLVAPCHRKGARILEEPSNDIDTVLSLFSRWKTAFVGYNACLAPFYVLLTDCVRTLRQRVLCHPEVKILFERPGASLPADPRQSFVPGMALFGRQPGDTISTVALIDPTRLTGSVVLYAGWEVEGRPHGTPNQGCVPFPTQLLRAVVTDPLIAHSLRRPAGTPMTVQ